MSAFADYFVSLFMTWPYCRIALFNISLKKCTSYGVAIVLFLIKIRANKYPVSFKCRSTSRAEFSESKMNECSVCSVSVSVTADDVTKWSWTAETDDVTVSLNIMYLKKAGPFHLADGIDHYLQFYRITNFWNL